MVSRNRVEGSADGPPNEGKRRAESLPPLPGMQHSTRPRSPRDLANPIRVRAMNLASARSLVILAALWAAACAVNPATGKRELALVGEGQEVQMGREADGEVSSSLGLVADTALQTYIGRVGLQLAATSERPELPWSFKVVDDPVVNAFALPGGFIFVTRGILAHFESEAELAGVLGHEIGHVTARHSVSQMSRQQIQQIGLGVGMILSEDVRKYGDILAAGLGLLNLRYSRGDETQADELGVRYISRVGYDPEAMVGVFQMLATVGGGGGGARLPEWQLTHPYPENREAHIREVIRSVGVTPSLDAGRDRYLDRIHGLVYGENPREGYFKGSLFLHPDLAFRLRFPEGWRTVNQRSAVAAVTPAEDALVILELEEGASDPAVALRAFLTQDGMRGGTARAGRTGQIAWARAPFASTSEQGELRGDVLFARHGGNVYRILAVASSTAWTAAAGPAAATLDSFAALTDPAVLAVRPRTIRVVTLRADATFEDFYRRNPMPIPLAEAALLNRRDPGERIAAGTRLKRVVGDPLP